jgi:hypothetical protein
MFSSACTNQEGAADLDSRLACAAVTREGRKARGDDIPQGRISDRADAGGGMAEKAHRGFTLAGPFDERPTPSFSPYLRR